MRCPTRVAALCLAAIAVPTSAVATAPADDQVVADAAIEAFTDRVTADGWRAFGPYEVDADDDGSRPQSECELEFTATDLFDLGPFPGETARATSDQFSFDVDDPASSAASATEPGLPAEEVTVAFAITVDPAHTAELKALVNTVGSPEFAECMDEVFTVQLAQPDPDQTDALPMEQTVDAESVADLGVGDASASIRFIIDFAFEVPTSEVELAPYRSDTTLHVALVDRTLVALWTVYTGTAEPRSGIDPIAELGALAASFGG